MSTFYKTSSIWVIDFQYEGRARRWFKAFGPQDDVRAVMAAHLRDLYGDRAQLIAVAPATEAEERQYLRGEEPRNVYCPTGIASKLPKSSS